MARPEGFEPPTKEVEAPCSIQLSYGRPPTRLARIVAGRNGGHDPRMTEPMRITSIAADRVEAGRLRYYDIVMAAFVAILKRFNIDHRVVTEQWPKVGTMDLTSHVAALKAAKPDLIFSSLLFADLPVFMKQI